MFTPKVWAGGEGSRGHPHSSCHLPGWVEGGRPRVGGTVVDPGKVGVSPPGSGGAWIPSSDRQSLCPANSGASHLPSTLLLLPQPHIWPSPQSHPKPSLQPVDQAVYQERHASQLTLLLAPSCTPLPTGVHPYSAGLSVIQSQAPRSPVTPHLMLIKGGHHCLWGRTSYSFSKSGPWKQNDFGSTLPLVPPSHSKCPLTLVLRYNPDLDTSTAISGGPDPCSAWVMGQGLNTFKTYFILHFSIAHLLQVRGSGG